MPRTNQPAALKLMKGTRPGADSGGRKVKLPPKFCRIAPEAPEWLSPEARSLWERTIPELLRLELIKAEDGENFAAYCETWAIFVQATKTIQQEGLTIEAKQGKLAHPAVGIARNAGRELRAFAGQFGLTPSAENALAVGDAHDEGESPFGVATG